MRLHSLYLRFPYSVSVRRELSLSLYLRKAGVSVSLSLEAWYTLLSRERVGTGIVEREGRVFGVVGVAIMKDAKGVEGKEREVKERKGRLWKGVRLGEDKLY